MASSGSKLTLRSLRVQNLRGFADATLSLDSPVLFLVGPNNSGKTSLLRLLDVVFNWDLAREFESVSEDLLELLLPARDTRNRARRLTLGVGVADGRRHRALKCKSGIAQLRLSLTVNDRRLRANLGDPERREEHDPRAAQLLEELWSEYVYAHIPAGRSVDSGDFANALAEAMTETLLATVRQPGKGATKEERAARKVVNSLESIAAPIESFWGAFLDRLPAGWVRGGSATSNLDREVLAEFLVDQFDLQLVTGNHDESGVPPAEVGSGLQSLLDLELRRYAAEVQSKHLLLAIEEPEAFLHPSAQRHFGRLLSTEQLSGRAIVSTHSPLFVEEASFEQVAIVREHQFHQPRVVDETRSAINTVLMTGRGAEVFFARSVLLVEGPGDREYWEALRRRVARHDKSGAVDHCFVVDVGANSRFAPWIRLVRSYSPSPFRWMAVLDSDSVKEAREAVAHAGLQLTPRQSAELESIRTAVAGNDLSECDAAARRLATAAANEIPLLLAPGDLENIMCAGLAGATVAALSGELGLTASTPGELADKLGTKHRPGGSAIDDRRKDPWMRALIAQQTPVDQLDPFVLSVLERWLAGVLPLKHATSVVQAFRTT